MMLVYRILFYSFEYELDQAKLHGEVEDLAKGMFCASATNFPINFQLLRILMSRSCSDKSKSVKKWKIYLSVLRSASSHQPSPGVFFIFIINFKFYF